MTCRYADRVPRCCPEHRMAVLDLIGEMLAIDAYDSVTEMVREGWPVPAAVEAYRRWILDRLTMAIDAGALFAEGAV